MSFFIFKMKSLPLNMHQSRVSYVHYSLCYNKAVVIKKRGHFSYRKVQHYTRTNIHH